MTETSQIRTAVVFDLEFTAWEGSWDRRWLGPGEFKEVVQIGALKVDAVTFAELASFELLVKPRINPVLSDYLVNLTGVTNEALAGRGVDFLEAYRRFLEFADGRVICAFGRDDLVFAENIRIYGIRHAPSTPRYINIAPWLAENGIETKGMHACDVGPRAGVPFEGRMHDALDDARSVAGGIAALVKRGARNPFV
jgi:inhibitor of KinA sporulation pathway (predicted exonuclease)